MLIKLTIDRFEGDWAVLKTADDESINWPKNKLPAQAREGNSLLFLVSDNPKEDKASRDLAREILKEILNPAAS
jgi:hypothetical protein